MSRGKPQAGAFEYCLVGAMTLFTGLLFLVFPGIIFLALLPPWMGLPLAGAVACFGAYTFARFGDNVLGTDFTR